MRKSVLCLLVLTVSTSAFAQSIDRDRDRWRERRTFYPRETQFELTMFGGYRYGGTLYADRTDLFGVDLDVESSANWGGSVGIPLGDSPMKLELMVNRQDTHLRAGSGLFEPNERIADFDVTYFHGGVQIPFSHSQSATPFFVISAGIANLDPQIIGVSAENRFSASAGLGVKVPFNRNVGLRVEARGYFTSLGNNDDNRCFRCDFNDRNLYQGETNVGLLISF
jgi:hypothetical protein